MQCGVDLGWRGLADVGGEGGDCFLDGLQVGEEVALTGGGLFLGGEFGLGAGEAGSYILEAGVEGGFVDDFVFVEVEQALFFFAQVCDLFGDKVLILGGGFEGEFVYVLDGFDNFREAKILSKFCDCFPLLFFLLPFKILLVQQPFDGFELFFFIHHFYSTAFLLACKHP